MCIRSRALYAILLRVVEIWDHDGNETPLSAMSRNVLSVYPTSGATAVLPSTPQNSYLPTKASSWEAH
jgi:hypothetical protein